MLILLQLQGYAKKALWRHIVYLQQNASSIYGHRRYITPSLYNPFNIQTTLLAKNVRGVFKDSFCAISLVESHSHFRTDCFLPFLVQCSLCSCLVCCSGHLASQGVCAFIFIGLSFSNVLQLCKLFRPKLRL